VGYDSTMYDVTRLTDIVSGFVINNRQTVRACLEQLAAAYFFDCVESDGLLKFVKRGKVSNVTIDYHRADAHRRTMHAYHHPHAGA
jgi:hypothetical protein